MAEFISGVHLTFTVEFEQVVLHVTLSRYTFFHLNHFALSLISN